MIDMNPSGSQGSIDGNLVELRVAVGAIGSQSMSKIGTQIILRTHDCHAAKWAQSPTHEDIVKLGEVVDIIIVGQEHFVNCGVFTGGAIENI